VSLSLFLSVSRKVISPAQKFSPLLRGKSCAAFLTAAFQDETAGAGGHTGEETDATFAASVRGLESSFHFCTFSFIFSVILLCFSLSTGHNYSGD
jgi:hypothetical protein